MNSPPSEKLNVELSECDHEPIRIPGSIQPHGFLLATSEGSSAVVQASANAAERLGKPMEAILGRPLEEVVGKETAGWLVAALGAQDIRDNPVYLGLVELQASGSYDVLGHVHDQLTIIEFESVERHTASDFRQLHPLLTSFVNRLSHSTSVDEISTLAAREIKQLTGYGRVLVYRFDEQGHGHVFAEALEPGYTSYRNHRFPAPDIPNQARELYLINRTRQIVDANYVPAPLVPSHNPMTGKPTDLTYSALRSVSPVHVAYLKNMGTPASMSFSIVIKGRLWGLISCHDHEPKFAPFVARATCAQLGQILAMRIESMEELAKNDFRLELRRMLVSMLSSLSKDNDLVSGMNAISHELLRFANASGAALIFERSLTRYGDAPEEEQIRDLVSWLAEYGNGDIFATDKLPVHYPPARDMKHNASGILAVPISQIHRHYLIWFRPEAVQTIDWAGNPHLKKEHKPGEALTPRTSFDTWRETVLGASLPWSSVEVEAMYEFRAALLGIVLERAEQMAELAEELGRANKELESFSYSVSHDLRAPLRHIVGFTDLLLEFEQNQLSERGNRFLNNIKTSAHFAGKLVDDLLSFSQMGRAALRVRKVDMDELMHSTIQKLTQDAEGAKVQWEIAGKLPAIDADPAFLQLALYNLLSNAIKYSRNAEQPVVSISSESRETETIFHVTDNGVGFNMEYVHKLFGVFQRLHRMEEFEGTGIGLANVRRIVERHGGRVWAESEPGKGAKFSFAIPIQLTLTEGDRYAETDSSG